MTEKCENCHYLDTSKHENDQRTKHMGICTKFCEISFKWEKCKQFLPVQEKDEKEIFIPLVDVSKLPPITQLNLF